MEGCVDKEKNIGWLHVHDKMGWLGEDTTGSKWVNFFPAPSLDPLPNTEYRVVFRKGKKFCG